jgi:hypothetical protein
MGHWSFAGVSSGAREEGEAVMAEHSPTPWRVDPDFCSDIQDNEGNEIGCVLSSVDLGGEWLINGQIPLDEDTRDANAAFIVKAVNSYDALKEALVEARHCLVSFTGGEDGACAETIRRIAAALSKSRGQS